MQFVRINGWVLLLLTISLSVMVESTFADHNLPNNRISDVSNTRHNFSAGLTPNFPAGASRNVAAVNEQQICVFCHTPHAAAQAVAPTPLWNRKLSSEMGLAISGRNLYVSDADGVVHAMDKTSGTTVWKNDQLLRRQTSRPLVLDSFVIVGDFEGYLHALSSDDGRMMARIDTDGSPIPSAPQEMDDGLLVETRDGGLYSISIQ